MATIEKRGNTYKIIVSKGYDINGKQLRERMTWVPNAGLTTKQIEKELNRQATLFEEQVKFSNTHNGNIRLVDFTELFLKDFARPTLKVKTVVNYEEKMKIINEALGHIKLKDLKPGHINSFYANLHEEGMRMRRAAKAKFDFEKWFNETKKPATTLAVESGISAGTFQKLKKEENISLKNAEAISKFAGLEFKDAFDIVRNNTPLSASTIQTYHRVLSAVLGKAVQWGYIASNPASRADVPSIGYHEAAYLDEPDARRLLELLQSEPIKWRALITFDVFSGLRRGEIAGLRWKDIDSESHTIMISQTSNYLPGKGVYLDTPKSRKSQRCLKLSTTAFLMLFEYKDWQDKQKQKLGDAWLNTDDRIFTNDFGEPIFPDSITQWFTGFIKRSGLPKVTVHSLRHTYASLMIADGVPLVIVSHNLGHAQQSTTSNIYTHVIASAEAKAAQTFDKFDDILQAKKESEPNPIVEISKIG